MNEEKCFPLPKGFDAEQFPNTADYIRLHGIHKCMSEWDLKKPYKTTEEVYKECLKREITWEELLKFKGYDEDILL